MLRNPYYIGVVKYCGRRVPNGRHPRLVDRDTFNRVQALLAARAVADDRPYRHHHYLRGSLYCADSGGRLLYGKHRGNGGGLRVLLLHHPDDAWQTADTARRSTIPST